MTLNAMFVIRMSMKCFSDVLSMRRLLNPTMVKLLVCNDVSPLSKHDCKVCDDSFAQLEPQRAYRHECSLGQALIQMRPDAPNVT